FVSKTTRALHLLLWLHLIKRRIVKDPARYSYMDQALTPVTEDETEKLELFTHSDTARQAVAHAHKIDQLTHAPKAEKAEAHAGSRGDAANRCRARCARFAPYSGGTRRRRFRSSAPPRVRRAERTACQSRSGRPGLRSNSVAARPAPPPTARTPNTSDAARGY